MQRKDDNVPLRLPGKIHFRHPDPDPLNWTQSPHVMGYMLEGNWTLCRQGNYRITSNWDEVTCKACLTLRGVTK